ncbi:MAG: excinuclease ABC subunit UvrC [Pseudomonadota bacterium]|nr:excinuclease ABC subunit UvrC [Pseudomonadota bacterium]
MTFSPNISIPLQGAKLIESLLTNLPRGPGVYRMADRHGKPLYVGKAKNLHKRVAAYARPKRLPERIRLMISKTAEVEIVSTKSEVEALLLESNLIKTMKPRYNIILRDDKSFPYILLRKNTRWAQLVKHRGKLRDDGEYFGPFASAGAVNRTLNTLQKLFPLRSCSDSIFTNRTRPCLQHQIKRCTAPCVGYISPDAYNEIVQQAHNFLIGRSIKVQKTLSKKMETASNSLDFEAAAEYRDRIRALTLIQAKQDINVGTISEADIVAAHQDGGITCIQVFFYRAGQNYGNRTYFPSHAKSISVEEVLESFLGQFYSDKKPPKLVLVSHQLPDLELVQKALSSSASHRVQIVKPSRGIRRKILENTIQNVVEAHALRLSESSTHTRLLGETKELFDLENIPKRIEVYDNSHISGTNAVGVMIVAGTNGFEKSAYRKYNIKNPDIKPGDDYGMMREVLHRRLSRALKENTDQNNQTWPDLILIDGGPGQLAAAVEAMEEVGMTNLPIVAIAKGKERDAGRERFYVPGRNAFTLPVQSPVLYFLQRLRDEAHRFAIGSHRSRRRKTVGQSIIDEIPGIGVKRKRALLNRFGSVSNISGAGLEDLEAVHGISKTVASKIYNHFN